MLCFSVSNEHKVLRLCTSLCMSEISWLRAECAQKWSPRSFNFSKSSSKYLILWTDYSPKVNITMLTTYSNKTPFPACNWKPCFTHETMAHLQKDWNEKTWHTNYINKNKICIQKHPQDLKIILWKKEL